MLYILYHKEKQYKIIMTEAKCLERSQEFRNIFVYHVVLCMSDFSCVLLASWIAMLAQSASYEKLSAIFSQSSSQQLTGVFSKPDGPRIPIVDLNCEFGHIYCCFLINIVPTILFPSHLTLKTLVLYIALGSSFLFHIFSLF